MVDGAYLNLRLSREFLIPTQRFTRIFFFYRLARCNDPSILDRSECVGVFMRRVFVTKMKLKLGANESYPAMLVPRVW